MSLYNTYSTYRDLGRTMKCLDCGTDISDYPSYMRFCSRCFDKRIIKKPRNITPTSEQTKKE